MLDQDYHCIVSFLFISLQESPFKGNKTLLRLWLKVVSDTILFKSSILLILSFKKFQGVSIAWWIWHILWSTLWEEHSMGYRIPIWVYTRSSVCRKHYEFICLLILGTLSTHSFVDAGICVYDTHRIKGRSYYPCQTTLLIAKNANRATAE